MDIAFELTSDPAELHEFLDVCSRSISAFVDTTLSAIAAQIDLERDELTRGTHAERRETVALILDGAPIARQRAEGRLGYALTGLHTAAVIWSDDPDGDLARLDARSRGLRARRGRSAAADRAGQYGDPMGLGSGHREHRRIAARRSADCPMSASRSDRRPSGVDGFRRSHFDAITTQQLMARLGSPQRIALFTDVQLVALITADTDRAAEFVNHTLGDLESAGDRVAGHRKDIRRRAVQRLPRRGAPVHASQHAAAPARPRRRTAAPGRSQNPVSRWPSPWTLCAGRGNRGDPPNAASTYRNASSFRSQRARRRHIRMRRRRHRGIGWIDARDESAETPRGF